MKGKKMPQVGRVEVSIMEEDQSRLLAFQKGELDLMNLEGPLAPKVLNGGTLTPEMQQQGVKLSRFVDPELMYHYWNLMDPVVGGLSTEKIALRRAMAMAYDVDEEIRIVRNGQAVEAAYPDPAGRGRSRPATTAASSSTIRLKPTRCSTSSATRRPRTAGARCRTASR